MIKRLFILAPFILAACTAGAPQDGGQIQVSAQQSQDGNSAAMSSVMGKIDAAVEKLLQEAEESGDPQQLLATLDQIHKLKPQNPDIAVRYAHALRDNEQTDKAKQVLAPFTQGEMKSSAALAELALIELTLADYKSAEAAAREAVSANPQEGKAYLALGTALDAQGYHEQAELAFRRGIDNWKGDPAQILNNLALNLASQGKLKESVAVLQRAKAASPDRIEIERNLRIISTLLETAEPPAPQPVSKPDNNKLEYKKEQAEKMESPTQ